MVNVEVLEIPIEVALNEQLSSTEKLVYGILKVLKEKPGNDDIAKLLSISPSSVNQSLHNLAKLNLIERTRDGIYRQIKVVSPSEEEKKVKQELVRSTNSYLLIRGITSLRSKEVIKSISKSNNMSLGNERRPYSRKLTSTKSKEPDITKFIELWETYGFPLSKEGTKRYEADIEALISLVKGTAFIEQNVLPQFKRPYTLEEWRKSLDRMFITATDPSYYPPDKSNYAKMRISLFIKNPFVGNGNSSLFLKYLQNEPKKLPAFAPKPDRNFTLTESIKRHYRSKIGDKKFSVMDLNKFIDASERLRVFMAEYKSRIPQFSYFLGTHDQQASLLIEAVMENNPKYIVPGYLCADFVFSEKLPALLERKGLLKCQ